MVHWVNMTSGKDFCIIGCDLFVDQLLRRQLRFQIKQQLQNADSHILAHLEPWDLCDHMMSARPSISQQLALNNIS